MRLQRPAMRTGLTEQFTKKTTTDDRALVYDIADGNGCADA